MSPSQIMKLYQPPKSQVAPSLPRPSGVVPAPNSDSKNHRSPITDHHSSIPTSPRLRGPHVAAATDHNGEQTCGGLGKPLGQGEGLPSSQMENAKCSMLDAQCTPPALIQFRP